MAVDIKKPNTAIAEKFKRTKSELEALFDVPPPIHHVGSTAVPGVNGKNILDILISANDNQHMNHIKAKLLAAGYFPSRKPSTRPDYLFLASRIEETGEGDIHIHIAIAGTETHDDFLTLRDYLRSHKD